MFEDYFQEEYGKETIVTEHGFCCYVLNGKELFFSDIYIKPEHRGTLACKKLFERAKVIAKENYCEHITGIVSVGVQEPERVGKLLRTYLAMGFGIYKAQNNQIVVGMKL